MTRKKKGSATPPRFAVGDHVRVKPGVADPDWPDLPLGGWAGEITEIDKRRSPTYLILWNKHTLDSMHTVYRQRAEKDGVGFQELWLGGKDLLPDMGEPVPIEQPKPRPLSPDNHDDRIRAAIGITSDQPLPNVTEDALIIYYEYLAVRLTVPFDAKYSADTWTESRSHSITVLGLLDPQEYGHSDRGLFCRARQGKRLIQVSLWEVEVPKRNPNHQLVADYLYWFGNFQ